MNNNVSMVWGSEYLDAGFTAVPNMVIRYAPKLITGKEFHFLMILSSYKHDQYYPYPSQDTIAEIMGVTTRQIRKLVESLEKKNYIEVLHRYDKNGRSSNIYNFKPLLDECLLLHRKEVMKKEMKDGVKVIKKRSYKRVEEQNIPVSVAEQNVPELPEQNVPELPEQNVPIPPEQNVPMNITIENNNKKITIENHHLVKLTSKQRTILKVFIENNRIDDDDIINLLIDKLINKKFNSVKYIEKVYQTIVDSLTNDKKSKDVTRKKGKDNLGEKVLNKWSNNQDIVKESEMGEIELEEYLKGIL